MDDQHRDSNSSPEVPSNTDPSFAHENMHGKYRNLASNEVPNQEPPVQNSSRDRLPKLHISPEGQSHDEILSAPSNVSGTTKDNIENQSGVADQDYALVLHDVDRLSVADTIEGIEEIDRKDRRNMRVHFVDKQGHREYRCNDTGKYKDGGICNCEDCQLFRICQQNSNRSSTKTSSNRVASSPRPLRSTSSLGGAILRKCIGKTGAEGIEAACQEKEQRLRERRRTSTGPQPQKNQEGLSPGWIRTSSGLLKKVNNCRN